MTKVIAICDGRFCAERQTAESRHGGLDSNEDKTLKERREEMDRDVTRWRWGGLK